METVTVSIRVNGRKLPPKSGFPFRSYVREVEIAPDAAESLVELVQAYAKKAKAETTREQDKPFLDDNGNPAKPPF